MTLLIHHPDAAAQSSSEMLMVTLLNVKPHSHTVCALKHSEKCTCYTVLIASVCSDFKF
jgi:hypothetical protein